MHRVIEAEKPLDMLIHLGDLEGSEHKLHQLAGKECCVHAVMGNNDFFSSLEGEKEILIGPYRALLTHGHLYNVSLGVERLKQEAFERGMDIAMFGHTHKPYEEEDGSLLVLNPGSISYPRQEGRMPSYMVIVLDENDALSVEIKYLPKEEEITKAAAPEKR